MSILCRLITPRWPGGRDHWEAGPQDHPAGREGEAAGRHGARDERTQQVEEQEDWEYSNGLLMFI